MLHKHLVFLIAFNFSAFQCLGCAQKGRRSASLKHSMAFNSISSDVAPSQRVKLSCFHQPLSRACIISLLFFKTQCSPYILSAISTLRWGDQHVTPYLDEAAQMIYSETVHRDVICAIRSSCFFDIREVQMFPTAAAQQQTFQQATHRDG